MRRLTPKTQTAYIRAVSWFSAYLERPPETASVEDLRNFQLHLVEQGTSLVTPNATTTGLKFTLDRSSIKQIRSCVVSVQSAHLESRGGS